MPIQPTCRYAHGDLQRIEVDGDAEYIVLRRRQKQPQSREGFILELWECPSCSYVELHDPDKRTE